MRELLCQRIIIQSSIRMEFDPVDDDTIFCSYNLPWDDIRMVFHFCQQNNISLHEISRLHETLSDQIKRIGRIIGENDLCI